ncbi:MAG: helix-turn-helix domain-containing protein [Oscillospiraceae bacterium]|nr:helix-turn-helix domain-containing protein [Oscillospiraceae bacterium]
MKTFGEKMLEARKARGMKQTDFGKLLGVSSRMIIDYESNQRKPHRKKLQEFADILELPIEYLLDDRYNTVLAVYNNEPEEPDTFALKMLEAAHPSLDMPLAEIEAQARREIEFLRERSVALFAGGALPQDVKDAFFQSLYEAYLKCREQASENGVDVNKFGY